VRVEQRGGFGRAFQPHVHPLQQVGLVEHRLNDVAFRARQVAVRCDGSDRAIIKRIIADAASNVSASNCGSSSQLGMPE
jgi:hypothetical protein